MWLFFTIWWDLFRVQSVKEGEKKEDGVFLFTPTCTLPYSSSANKKVWVVGQELFMLCAAVKIEHDVTGYSLPKYM